MEIPDPWPLGHLVLRTPRLELRPDDDAGLVELAEEAAHGVHPPERMPFSYPWSDAPAEDLGRNILQYHWRERAGVSRDEWRLNFLVCLDGRVIGTQGLTATEFGTRRECATGSWIGMRHQGDGIGTEMRAAVLAFAFDHLGATQVRSDAMVDNLASLRVSEKLGYVEDGTMLVSPRGEVVTAVRLLVTRDRFDAHRPEWTLKVDGVKEVLGLLGAG